MDSKEREHTCFFKNQDSMEHKIVSTHVRIGKSHRMLLEHHLNKNGLFRSQHQLLMCIFQNPDASQKDLAKFHNVSTAAIAMSLKKLEKGGYVERSADSQDNRFNKVAITEKGFREAVKSQEFFIKVEQRMLDGFSDGEKEALYGYLNRIYENLGKMLQETKQ